MTARDWPFSGRFALLTAGLTLQGVGVAAQIRSGLGLGPWDVLHDGLARLTGLSFGTVIILVTVVALIPWWPLGERPHVGTVLNIFVAAVVIDWILGWTVPAGSLWLQIVLQVGGILVFAFGQGMYLVPDLGVGAREGLMTGLNRRFGTSIRLSRTIVEISVLLIGVLLGGSVGVGTLLFAVAIGPLVQYFGRVLGYRPPAERAADHVGRTASD
ncbi:membrane protein [Streptosporangium violaceochromogenes]|nr:membrane protein [Streptosporangium violaceochromogenes]